MDKKISWRKYNDELIERGKISFWFDESISENWYTGNEKLGPYQNIYSDNCITALLTLKFVYTLTYREVAGLSQNLIELLDMEVEVPHYTTLSRRAKKLGQELISKLNSHEKVHVVIDSTGLKVYGEGEWKVRKHGYEKRRTWRKLHLAVDEKNNQIVAVVTTGNDKGDSELFGELLDQVQSDNIEQISADGAYDTKDCYKKAKDLDAKLVAPPR